MVESCRTDSPCPDIEPDTSNTRRRSRGRVFSFGEATIVKAPFALSGLLDAATSFKSEAVSVGWLIHNDNLCGYLTLTHSRVGRQSTSSDIESITKVVMLLRACVFGLCSKVSFSNSLKILASTEAKIPFNAMINSPLPTWV